MNDSWGWTERRHDGVIAVVGELDVVSTGDLARFVDESGTRVRLDLSEVTFIGSDALNVLVRARQRLGGGFVIIRASPVVRRLFELTDLVDLMLPDARDGP